MTTAQQDKCAGLMPPDAVSSHSPRDLEALALPTERVAALALRCRATTPFPREAQAGPERPLLVWEWEEV